MKKHKFDNMIQMLTNCIDMKPQYDHYEPIEVDLIVARQDKKIIGSYLSVREASRKLKVSPHAINTALRGKGRILKQQGITLKHEVDNM